MCLWGMVPKSFQKTSEINLLQSCWRSDSLRVAHRMHTSIMEHVLNPLSSASNLYTVHTWCIYVIMSYVSQQNKVLIADGFFSMWSAEVRVYPPLLGLLKQTGLRPVVLPKQALVFIAMTGRSFHSYIHSWVQPDLPNAVKFDQIQTWFCCCSFVFLWLTGLLTVIHSYFTVNPQAPNNNNLLILWIYKKSSLMIFFLCRTTAKFSVQLHVCL